MAEKATMPIVQVVILALCMVMPAVGINPQVVTQDAYLNTQLDTSASFGQDLSIVDGTIIGSTKGSGVHSIKMTASDKKDKSNFAAFGGIDMNVESHDALIGGQALYDDIVLVDGALPPDLEMKTNVLTTGGIVSASVTGPTSEAITIPGSYGFYNDENAFKLQGYRWLDNPKINFFVRDDKNLRGEGLTGKDVGDSILAGANTWDNAITTQDLFKDSPPIVIPVNDAAPDAITINVPSDVASVQTINVPMAATVDRFDGKNVHAFADFTGDALAYSRTWYYTNRYVPGTSYRQAVESDMVYNTNWDWTMDISKADLSSRILDFQSVATHEMGHTLGLADLYTDPTYKFDLAQIMGFYDDFNDPIIGGIEWESPQRNLGAGDLAGIHKIYGA